MSVTTLIEWACPECDERRPARDGETMRRCQNGHPPFAMKLVVGELAPSSVREGGDGPHEVFVVLTHDNCFINAYLTHEAAEREASGDGRYLVYLVELPDAEEAPDAAA